MRRYSVRQRGDMPEAVRFAIDTHFPRHVSQEVLTPLKAIEADDAEECERVAHGQKNDRYAG